MIIMSSTTLEITIFDFRNLDFDRNVEARIGSNPVSVFVVRADVQHRIQLISVVFIVVVGNQCDHLL